MHIELGTPYRPTWRGTPPQLLTSDNPVCNAYRDKHVGDWDEFYYNVAMTMRDFPPTWSKEQIKAATYSLGKRIDVVAVRKDLVWLIEVTDRAMVRSVGQAIVYRTMWAKLRPFAQPFEAVILCRYTDEDIIYVCEQQKIRLITVTI